MNNTQRYNGVMASFKDIIDKLESGFYGKGEDFNINPFAEDIENFAVILCEDYDAIVDE